MHLSIIYDLFYICSIFCQPDRSVLTFSILLQIFVTFGSHGATHWGFNRYCSEPLFQECEQLNGSFGDTIMSLPDELPLNILS